MICEFELPDVSLRCFVARQLLSQIYALSSVKFPGLKLRLCKKNDKYEVCLDSIASDLIGLIASTFSPMCSSNTHTLENFGCVESERIFNEIFVAGKNKRKPWDI